MPRHPDEQPSWVRRATAAAGTLVLLGACSGEAPGDPRSIELDEDGQPGQPDAPADGDAAEADGTEASNGEVADGDASGSEGSDGSGADGAGDDGASGGASSGGSDDAGAGGDGSGDDGAGGDGSGGDGSGDGGAGADAGDDGADGGPGIAGLASDGVVDLTTAEPGTWPVGNAGIVTFDLDGRDIVLRGVEAAPGWSAEVSEDGRDKLEVGFRRDRERWRLHVKRSGGDLEVRIDQRLDDAATGGYDLSDAGTVTFDVRNGRLVLTSLQVADGWSIHDLDEDDDELDVELRTDGRRVAAEVELDDDQVELAMDYRVRSRIP